MSAPTPKSTPAFYHHLGKLFYAVAAIDKEVRDEEFSKLQQCVRDFWLDLDDTVDVFGEDAAYLIEIVFEGIEAFETDPEEMYQAYMDYMKTHQQLFTTKVRNRILETAAAIAQSFAGLNKSELILLTQLKMDMERLDF
ncbi:MAG: hypothetical protein ABNH00_00320 [Dokdonia sp.]|jgi:hypothetical protein